MEIILKKSSNGISGKYFDDIKSISNCFFLSIFRLRWDKPESNIRVPFSFIPEYKKKVNSKVGSLDYITHKPGKQTFFFEVFYR